jgi:hypothetical protein
MWPGVVHADSQKTKAGRIGVVFLDAQIGLVVEKAVEHIG